jgi:Cu-Zn family superoxide dismutase
MRRWKLWTGAVGAVVGALGIVTYGCSDDPPAPGTTPRTDSGARDTSTTQDSPSTSDTGAPDTGADTGPQTYTARADIRPSFDGGTVNGTATFTEQNNAVTVVVAISGGLPEGYHGMHIHQNGSCDPTTSDAGIVTNAGAAGGHWNLYDAGHGYPDASSHHIGDMGNILINDAGVGSLTMSSTDWRVQGDGGQSVVGHAVIFHAGTDDGVSQPVGDAGPRPGCGVVIRQ